MSVDGILAAGAVGVVGAGYVGLATATGFCHLGHRVVAVDRDTTRIDRLRSGHSDLTEPGLDSVLQSGLDSGRLTLSTDFAELSRCEAVFICVPTPVDGAGHSDLSAVFDVIGKLIRIGGDICIVVIKSTVPVGTASRAERLLRPSAMAVVSNPEFLRESHIVTDFLDPDRIVIGDSDRVAGDRIAALYRGIEAPLERVSLESAELAKHASNAFLATKLSFVNELAALCERTGADIREVTAAMAHDHRIGEAFLSPGPGWGGSCLPKDARALLHSGREAGIELGVLDAAVAANTGATGRVIDTVRRGVTGSAQGNLHGRRIALLGLAFKAGTGDLRFSPALDICRSLIDEGATVAAYDPAIPQPVAGLPDEMELVDDPLLAAKDAAAVIVATEWPEFTELDWAAIADVADDPVVIDTRTFLDPGQLSRCGIRLYSNGIAPTGVLHPTSSW
ncbi:UDPglucose 6-dehydrogenase [Williamsia limnetica]|uniref:UDP-glucose 6-dehydrogenase n=1 Tax=Williamsia limnetica TaxID=882452 RepID=A0A318RW70_WILLI|nr:UDP-glucose/GDP-mannose dehydrogenase family protein [Williamsia limnetica]PYE17444.1 UDPglucose 6-dehydrogenase [Williamsia limnetica]